MGMDLQVRPRTSDGKELFTANALPEWCVLSQCGRGDAATKIGDGPFFQMACAGPEAEETLEFSFLDPVFVTSGIGIIKNAQLGDFIRFEVFAPPTVPTSAPGGDGNCNKVATGQGFNIIVPAAGNGDWNLDLESADCHLVPNPAGAGFWDIVSRDWSSSQIGADTMVPNATQTGSYDLYDTVGMHLSMFATDIPILGTDIVLRFGIENVRAKMVPSGWHWIVTLHAEEDSHTVSVGFFLQMGRARTYLPQHVPFVVS